MLFRKCALLSSVCVLAVSAHGAAAQTAPAAPPVSGDSTVVIVTGYRASLQNALNMKRKADVEIDAITADDIASFPDANLAESLQRIPGISITRDNGEGRQISVRGLGPEFSRVRVDGMETLATGGANDSGTRPNRSRAFDFSIFASELFNNLSVRKTADAKTDEGSLGATVDLQTARPFDIKGNKTVLGVQDAWYENGGKTSPRYTALVSRRWDDGKLGFLMSAAYEARSVENSLFAHAPGNADYVYRGESWAGNEYPQRAGFAAPAGTTFGQTVLTAPGKCPGSSATSPAGTVCNAAAITNPEIIAEETGSNPAAYAALYPSSNATAGRYDDSTVLIATPALNDQKLHYRRLGVTASFQAQLSEDTLLTIDFLGSHFYNASENYQLTPIGLNRNNTNATLNTLTAGAPIATKRGTYPSLCTPQTATATRYPQDCGAQLYGTTPAFTTGSDGKPAVLGSNIFSVNPYNLDPYDYYNNPNSAGYVPDPYGIGERAALIGRPGVKVMAADVKNGYADYLDLRGVDWGSRVDAAYTTTDFAQVAANLKHRFSDRFSMNAMIGASRSDMTQQGLLVELNNLDRPEDFIMDARNHPNMPEINPGFNAADPNNWGIVKGLSAMRSIIYTNDNHYASYRLDFNWLALDHHSFDFGLTGHKYTYLTDNFQRGLDTYNPTEKEAGVSVASLGQVVRFGNGLDLPAGTVTSFFAPSIAAFSKTFGFDCNCINKYGDFRITDKRSNGDGYGVIESVGDAYVKWNFTYDLPLGDLSGNAGVRVAHTDVNANGRSTSGAPLTGSNSYTDTLPSLNLTYRPVSDVYVRFGAAKTMARPTLSVLTPTITALSIPTTAGATTGATMTIGNPKVSPYRSTNYDLAVEWYFAKNALLSAALFDKEIKSFPQTVAFGAPLSTFLNAADIAALRAQQTNTNAQAYIDNDDDFTALQTRNAPGGYLRGWELNYQQPFTFLPWKFRNTGIQLNLTHVTSKLKYIINPGSATVTPTYADGPWLGASPDGLNLTLYYSTDAIDARISVASRSGYDKTYPIVTGACLPGLQAATIPGVSATQAPCDTPLMNDYVAARGTTNVDAKITWNFSPHLAFTLEGLNLTNQAAEEYAYLNSPVSTLYQTTGRQVTLGVRYKY